jgi:hypothetical protein
MRYLLRFLDASDPTASLKHLAYAVVVLCACGWLSYDLTIKSLSGTRLGIDGNWCAAFGLLLAAVTTGKIVGSGPSPSPTVGAVPDTVIKTDEVKS